MARFAVEYWETFSKVFYVEANDYNTAKKIVEDNVNDDPDIIEDVEMSDSGYKNVSDECTDISDDNRWNRLVDYIGETA